MKKYSDRLSLVADQLFNILKKYNSVEVKDYGWENYLWQSEQFSWAHLEKFCTDKVSVLHCVVMPHGNSNAPIYGFDVIEIGGNLTGMFMDLTPVDNRDFYMPDIMGERRPLPEWANFFSKNFVACKPTEHDIFLGVTVLENYLAQLPSIVLGDYRNQQQQYVAGQRENDTTFKMLKSFVGEDTATEFMNTVLFPDVL